MSVVKSLLGAFASMSMLNTVNGHSWLHCSDYDGTINGQDFDEDDCNGYIREWSSGWGAPGFASDLGINYFGSEGAWCQSDFSSDIESMYDIDAGYYPATWVVGETVTLVWPAKNHANYECFANIPDTSMKLYYNPSVNPDSELTGAVSSDWDLLTDFQDGCTAGTDGCGFQQCPEFCDSTDGAPCFGEYTVSRDDFPDEGYYTIMWYWIFNPGAPYTTCFEVYVSDTGASTDDTGGDETDDGDVTDDDGDTDDGGDDDDSDDSGSSSSEYIVTVPICYYGGGTYDEDTLIAGANAAFDGTTEVDWSVVTEINGDNGFNATIQTHADDPATVNSVSYSYATTESELCEAIEDEFDDDGTCTVCDPGGMATYSLSGSSSSGSSSSSSEDGYGVKLTIGLIVAGLVILSLLLFYVYREKINPQPKTQQSMAAHVPQNSHVARATTS